MPASPALLRVLIVDDEPHIADTLTLIVRANNYDARAVYSVEAAIDLAETFRPQAVLSDVMMPGKTGIDLAIYMAEKDPACRVLLMSGHNSAIEMMEEALKLGHTQTVLQKPVNPTDILGFLAGCRQA